MLDASSVRSAGRAGPCASGAHRSTSTDMAWAAQVGVGAQRPPSAMPARASRARAQAWLTPALEPDMWRSRNSPTCSAVGVRLGQGGS